MRRVPPGAAVLDPSLSRVQKQKSASMWAIHTPHGDQVVAEVESVSSKDGLLRNWRANQGCGRGLLKMHLACPGAAGREAAAMKRNRAVSGCQRSTRPARWKCEVISDNERHAG